MTICTSIPPICAVYAPRRDAYRVLATARAEIASSGGNSGGNSIFQLTHTALPPPQFHDRDPARHTHIRFWQQEHWDAFIEGMLPKDYKKDKVPLYLEDENGNTISHALYTKLREKTKEGVLTLNTYRVTPSTKQKCGFQMMVERQASFLVSPWRKLSA